MDKVWRDVRDSKWIGGDKEGWERVPYWLDGFIPLAYLLEDEELKKRAARYIDAILERQEEDRRKFLLRQQKKREKKRGR